MPIINTGPVNNPPTQVSTQFDAPDINSVTWKAVNPDHTVYGMNNLIEDIVSGISSFIVEKDPEKQTWYEQIITSFINKFSNPNTLKDDKQKWFDKWTEAFQKDPTKDTSSMIREMIKNNIGTIKDPSKWFMIAFSEGKQANDKLLDLLDKKMNSYMDDLPDSLPELLDLNQIKIDMANKVNAELKKIGLVSTDAGLGGINDLSKEALKEITSAFDRSSYQKTTPNRPYKVFDQDDAKNAALDKFNTNLHTQSAADTMVSAAFNKAISGASIQNSKGETVANLESILSGASSEAKLDSRFVEIFKEVAKNFDLKSMPVEVMEKLLGKNTADAFIKWMNTWDWLIDLTHVEESSSNGDGLTFSVNLKVKSGVEVIKAEGSKFPSISTNVVDDNLKREVKTSELSVKSFPYLVDVFQERYSSITSLQSSIEATVNEDDLKDIFGTVPIATGAMVENIKLDQMEKLDPITFAKLKKDIEDYEKIIKKNIEVVYPTFKYELSKINISFKVIFTKDGENKHIEIIPLVSDDNINSLPTIAWEVSSTTSSDDQKKVNDLFKIIDDSKKALAYSDFTPFKQKIVSPLDNAVSSLYDIFNTHKKLEGVNPFKDDVLGGAKEGASIPLSNFENVFKDLKLDLEKFDSDNNGRFKVEYFIEKIGEKSVSIKYKVTDTLSTNPKANFAEKTISGRKLDNILITFNESSDKAQFWLDRLKASKVVKNDFGTQGQLDDLAARNPMSLTKQELTDTFPKLDELIMLANAQSVTLSADKVEGIKDERGETLYYQWFKAEYQDPKDSKNIISHTLKMLISKVFMTQDQIDAVKKVIDDKSEKVIDTMKNIGIDQDVQDKVKKIIDTEKGYIEKQLEASGITADQLKAIGGAAKGLFDELSNQVLGTKKLEILNELKKQFPGGNVPSEILKLFDSHWERFEDIIKKNPELLKDAKALAKLLNKFGAGAAMNAVRTMQTSGKIALLSLGGILGVGALLGGANAVKVGTTNRKSVNSRTGKIKSSKKLAALSVLIGLASAAGSIGTFIYLFIAQGGL